MKKGVKKICYILSLVCVLSLFGCGNDNVSEILDKNQVEQEEVDEGELKNKYSSKMDKIYENAIERVTNMDDVEEMEGTNIFDKLLRKFLGGYKRGFDLFMSIAWKIAICSFVTGVLMFLFARKNKQIKRTGLFVFALGIPALTILTIFVVGTVNGYFLY